MSKLDDIEPETDEERWIAKAAVSLYRTLRIFDGKHVVSSIIPVSEGKFISIRLRDASTIVEEIKVNQDK